MLPKTRPNRLILRLRIPRLDPADARLLRHGGAGLDIRPDAGLVVAEQARVFLVEHAVDFQDVTVAGGALELVARAVEAEDEGLFGGWEDRVAGFFFFFYFFVFFVLNVSEVGLCAVVAARAAVVAFFSLRFGGAVWSPVAVVAAVLVVGFVWHSWSVYSWARVGTTSIINGVVAID